jgi:hypothetical protein
VPNTNNGPGRGYLLLYPAHKKEEMMNPFNPFSTLTKPRPQQPRPMQVSGAYPNAYYPTQTSGFDFNSMINMFMPIMMMGMMLGMVGGLVGGTEESPSSAS